jgi:hypothetical protein
MKMESELTNTAGSGRPTVRFTAFLPFIFRWEGGYDNDPDDPGGETKYGIDHRSHPGVDIKKLTREGAATIYWSEYWLRFRCEELPVPLGEAFFNACVNCGAKRAKILLAEADCDAARFLAAQEAFYRRLVTAKPALRKFLHGWLNRTADLKRYLGL